MLPTLVGLVDAVEQWHSRGQAHQRISSAHFFWNGHRVELAALPGVQGGDPLTPEGAAADWRALGDVLLELMTTQRRLTSALQERLPAGVVAFLRSVTVTPPPKTWSAEALRAELRTSVALLAADDTQDPRLDWTTAYVLAATTDDNSPVHSRAPQRPGMTGLEVRPAADVGNKTIYGGPGFWED